MEHNLSNPRCPECNGITQKAGFLPTRKGKKQRYLCIECGRSFTEQKVIQ